MTICVSRAARFRTYPMRWRVRIRRQPVTKAYCLRLLFHAAAHLRKFNAAPVPSWIIGTAIPYVDPDEQAASYCAELLFALGVRLDLNDDSLLSDYTLPCPPLPVPNAYFQMLTSERWKHAESR